MFPWLPQCCWLLAVSLPSLLMQRRSNCSQQASDEKTCYDWAVQNTGIDPLAAPKNEEVQQPAEQQTSPRGGAGGAVRGAALGVIGGRRQARAAEQTAQAEAKETAEKTAAASEEQVKFFKNGFAACLEGKKYSVKY